MKKFLISESEKQRILGMHKRAIRKEWVLNEDVAEDNEKTTLQKLPDAAEFKKVLAKAEAANDFTAKYYFGKKATFYAVYGGEATFNRWNVYVRTFCLKKYDDGITYVDFLSGGPGDFIQLVFDGNPSTSGIPIIYSIDTTSLPANDGVTYWTQQLGPYSNPSTTISSNFAGLGELELQNMVTSIPSLVTRIQQLRTQVPDVIKKLTGGAKRVYDFAGKTVDIDAVRKSEEEAAAEREKSAAASAQAEKDKVAAAAKEKADMDARTAATDAERKQAGTAASSFSTPFNNLYNELLTLVSSSPMGSQQDIESKINQLNTMYNDPNLKTARYEATDNGSIATTVKNTPKLLQQAKAQYPGITATFGKTQ